MNCFAFQNRTSDFLDGQLSTEERIELDKHMSECRDCEERIRHFRTIVEMIAAPPKSLPPAAIGKLPRRISLHPMGMARSSKRLWKGIPWYLRTTIEGASVVLLVLAAVSTGPKLRMLYERSIERSMTELTETFNDPLLNSSEMPPLVRGSSAVTTAGANANEDEFMDDADVPTNDDADGGANSAAAGAPVGEGDVKVGSSEIWRFNMKTDSPHDMRARVVQIFAELNVPSSTPGLGGIEAPGGIQFDLMVPQSAVGPLKKQLEKAAPRPPANSSVSETFAWYKNKSRRSIPAGRTRVVIWLSQM